MSSRLFWRALGMQALCAGIPFLVLLALPLPGALFENWGFAIGPLVWLGAALVASRFIPAPRSLVMLSALAGLVAGTIVLVVASHDAGGIAALLVFAASCSGYDGEREPAEAGSSRPPLRADERTG